MCVGALKLLSLPNEFRDYHRCVVIGFPVSSLEWGDAGQDYLPTITFVMGVKGMRSDALPHLILHNSMLATPLLIVFGFVYWGTTSAQLGNVLQRHLTPVKLRMGVLLFAHGIWLFLTLYNSKVREMIASKDFQVNCSGISSRTNKSKFLPSTDSQIRF